MIRGTNSFHETVPNLTGAPTRSTAADIPNALVTAPEAAEGTRWIMAIRG
jgi:hypothetical protein